MQPRTKWAATAILHYMEKEQIQNRPQKDRHKQSFFERLSGAKRERVSEDEFLDMVDDVDELNANEKQMINDIIALGDTEAGEICTPRVDIMLVNETDTARTALERMRGTGYSRLPVCREDIDDIVGIIHYKDLIGPLMDGSIDDQVSKYMYSAMFVPETKDALPLLGEMQTAHQQMAIVVDEYGGTEGVITIEDIVEEIVGEISDESDIQGDIVTRLDDDAWRVDGRLPVEDAIGLGWPVEPNDDYETIAGWLLSALDTVPASGDVIELDGYRFTIERMRRNRISAIRVERVDEVGAGDDRQDGATEGQASGDE